MQLEVQPPPLSPFSQCTVRNLRVAWLWQGFLGKQKRSRVRPRLAFSSLSVVCTVFSSVEAMHSVLVLVLLVSPFDLHSAIAMI